MSLYIFGMVVGRRGLAPPEEKLAALCARLDIALELDRLDEDDRLTLDEAAAGGLSANADRLYFSISSSPHDADATALWLEATELGLSLLTGAGVAVRPLNHADLGRIDWPADFREGMLACRLGNFISNLESVADGNVLAIALVDGGVETVRRSPARVCVDEILRSLVLAWDCTSNALYVCEG